MNVTGIHIAAGVMMGLLLTGAAWAADQPMTQTPYAHGHEDKLPNGMIGVSLQVGAEHIGDPAVLCRYGASGRTGSPSRAQAWG
jgi:hypothetical protein